MLAGLVAGCAKGGLVDQDDGGVVETSEGTAVGGSDGGTTTDGGEAPEPPPPDETDGGTSDGGETGEEPDPLPPAPPTCGDAMVDPGEQCDDGNAVDGDACVHCQNARCGDGVRYAAVEECDDGNGDDHDACRDTCVAAICGDGVLRDDTEVCDDGINDGDYGGCMPGCTALAPYCGDGLVGDEEHCDPDQQLPFDNVDCNASTCLYDFGGVPQIYCYGSCSWGGNYGCDQHEANILCRLTTGDPQSTATDWDLAYALDAPGFACPGFGVDMGTMPELGVAQTVYFQDFSILATHGAGAVIVNPSCT